MPDLTDADDVVRLPHSWRPFGARFMGTALGVMLLALATTVWIAWGPEVRADFTPFQKATLVFLGLLAFACWLAIMRSRVTAEQDRLVVVNGYRRREFEYSEVLAVSLRRGAPWALLDLSDGTTVSAIAIQGSDGARAARAVRELRAVVADRSRTERND